MIPEGIRVALDELKQVLRASFGDRLVRLVLFGSVARGITHEDSDVDVLVLVSPRLPRDGYRAVDAAVEVMLRRPEVVLSPLVMTPEELEKLRKGERRLARDLDREGIPL
ncbi:MAG: nucleotidyltransferase family protein [Deltaproteobacteria bacterium]